MGSTSADKEELTVLVTGFGPFKEQHPVNPSWEIASRLPDYLPPIRAKTAHPSSSSAAPLPPVRILVHPEAIRVNYQTVRGLVPRLWDLGGDKRRIDVAIHIGMAGPAMAYSVERRGHRDGYALKDVDGELLKDQDRRLREGEDWVWHGMPKEMETDFDLDDVLGRWKKHSPDGLDLRISEDAGRYLCDFIYFSSLAHLTKAQETKRVVFLHVPSNSSEKAIATGRELALQLIRSIVESEIARRKL
ncbi:putative pyroglutamyl peptidase type I [Phialemonium atrogriseum]|uniref:Pyroglutamyl peptidase type I n=1 Tax=Phialemonium atrogriseum TaxID=1093897 RepID=A0AAJ0FQQ6_9PEZI|nr:putative pyroglutamyl peptidase type I [Phialemonium atrogriseum]KAK1769410.1 putative pyroglutamyl peptidase type I [Phialemonium atrogriseum]